MTGSYENWIEQKLGIPIYSSNILKPNQALIVNTDILTKQFSTFDFAGFKSEEAKRNDERKREWRIRAGLIYR